MGSYFSGLPRQDEPVPSDTDPYKTKEPAIRRVFPKKRLSGGGRATRKRLLNHVYSGLLVED